MPRVAAGADQGDENARDRGADEPAKAVGDAAQGVGLLEALGRHDLLDEGGVGRKEEGVAAAVDEAQQGEAPDLGAAAEQQGGDDGHGDEAHEV